MPPRPRATSSPKRTKAKRKVAESGIPVLTGQGKKVWTADEVGLVSLQLSSDVNALPIRRSGRPGAGTGGRNAQLEKKPPPPYSISNGTGSTITSSCQKGKKAKTSSVPDPQAEPDITRGESSYQSLQPGLSLCETGGHFGFQTPQGSPPIVPPGTEPDLQALNNSYVAIMMAKKDAKYCACSAVQSLAGGHQSSSSGPANDDLLRSVPPSATLNLLSHPSFTARIVLTLSENYLDLSLRTIRILQALVKVAQVAKTTDYSTDSDNTGEREFGWAEVGEAAIVYTQVFLGNQNLPWSMLLPLLLPTSTFNTPANKDDMNTKQTLAFDKLSSNEIASEGARRVP
ncbi:uncharacterized protein EDB91DRAFT_1255870 [Suillus paluster]|uniref:uncharacterized protein n=1 Tax=Suillus paluster TaxID=48578 RepID=UPI001B87F42E|nr:uncharacterized protein EDB91DRAFT_1255870 [Suillus paluster]KAG1722884.1 hypothetical protein EDB91DRAFT_1255870 [Suillus paluster]